MPLGDFLGGVAGGFTDTTRTIGNQQYQQGLLKLDQQRLQMAQQARERERLEKAREQMWGVLQTGIEHAAEADPKGGIQQFMSHSKGLIDALRTNYSIDGPEAAKSFEGMLSGIQVGAANKLGAMRAEAFTKPEAMKPAVIKEGMFGEKTYGTPNPKTGRYEPTEIPEGGMFGPPGEKVLGATVEQLPNATVPPTGLPTSANRKDYSQGTTYVKTPFTPEQIQIIKHSGTDPSQFDFDAVMYAYGNTNVTTGYRSYRGINPVQALRGRAAQYWINKFPGREDAPQLANAVMAEFKAMQHGANAAAAIAAKTQVAQSRAQQTATRVLPLSEAVNRTDYPDINKIILFGKEKTGDPKVVQYGIALDTLAANYAAAKGMGNSVLTDFQYQNAVRLLQASWSKGQIKGAVDQMMLELESEKGGAVQGVKQFIGGMQDVMEGGAQGPASSGVSGGGSGVSGGVKWEIIGR